MKTILTLCALAICGALTLQAADAGKPAKPHGDGKPGKPHGDGKPGAAMHSPEEAFKKLDKDGDGALSKEEFMAGPRAKENPTKAEERFKKLDTNGDGKISLEEFKAGHKPGEGPKKPAAKE